ncbi:MFS transporter, AAHS family, cis,cis-muconate transporter [Peribacillus simplex]|uniref:MFS transporter, AAHS family, cis,cis-muconate transporter n=1 Tax=Peribacillus simplex TaxID=1478 RepID=A0A9X8RDK9_9BACI|nr:MFS transporter [Peribacillus simplex]SIS01436.1 MFS transporter, AAHS family, cis,cis-muconate transporter [Peribacillus simplex]
MSNSSRPRLWIIVFISSFLGLMVDAMDIQMLALSLPKLKEEFNMNNVQAGALGTWTLVGMAVGGLIGGWLSDRFGRVRTIFWSIIIFSIGTTLLVFAQSYEQFLAIRFISSFGLGAEYAVVNMLMAEYVPTKRRTTILGTLQAGWSVGYLVATLLAGAILPQYGWRPLFLIALVPVLLAVYMRFNIPEPEGWKQSAKKKANLKQNEWTSIFQEPKARRMFILWSLTSVLLQFGYYGVNNWLPSYIVSDLGYDFKKMTSYLVGTYTAMIVGKIIAGWLADKFGRKVIFVVGTIGTAVALPLIVNYQNPANIVILFTLFGFLIGIPYAVNATYMSESFSTQIRGTAVGGSYNIGRSGAALAPVMIGMIATNYSIGVGLSLMGVAYVLCGIIPALFIREKIYEPYMDQSSNNKSDSVNNSVNY